MILYSCVCVSSVNRVVQYTVAQHEKCALESNNTLIIPIVISCCCMDSGFVHVKDKQTVEFVSDTIKMFKMTFW